MKKFRIPKKKKKRIKKYGAAFYAITKGFLMAAKEAKRFNEAIAFLNETVKSRKAELKSDYQEGHFTFKKP